MNPNRPTGAPDPAAIDGNRPLLKKEIGAFLALAALWSLGVSLAMIAGLSEEVPRGDAQAVDRALGGLTMLYGFGPFVAALAVTAAWRGRAGLVSLFRRVVTWRVSPMWYLAALVVPLIPQWAGLAAWGWATGAHWSAPAPGVYLLSWLQIALISAVYFISEELGWRGFLLPRVLANRGWISSAIVVGVIWAVWHYPYWIISSWAMESPWPDIALSTLASSVRAVSLSILITWMIRPASGSVLIAMLFHGSNNANFGKMFEAAGPSALDGATFLAIQAASALLTALGVMAVARRGRRIPSGP